MSPSAVQHPPAPQRLPKPAVFYSRASNLMVQVTTPVQAMVNGSLVTFGGKIAQFMDQGDGFGRYVTDDPEVAAALENNAHVMTAEQYNDVTVGAEQKLALESQERKRLVIQNNNLLDDLQKRDAELAALRSKLSDLEKTPSKGK